VDAGVSGVVGGAGFVYGCVHVGDGVLNRDGDVGVLFKERSHWLGCCWTSTFITERTSY